MIGARQARRIRAVFSLVVGIVLLAACTEGSSPPGHTASPTGADGTSPEPTPGGEVTAFDRQTACGLPPEWLLRIRRGYDPERSGEMQILPEVPNFVGSGLPHVGPWSFTEDVPLLWYGPGYIKPIGPVQQPVTSADIAPTLAHLLGSSFQAEDGQPMLDALVPAEERPTPPRLVVVMVWDGAGRNVFEQWPDAYPNVTRLRPQGAWYEHATVGSSPTSSAQIHGTIGTGAFPEHHGVVGHTIRLDGELFSPWKDGPHVMKLDTFGDYYDREHDNRPLVGMSGSVAIQLAMMSRGTYAEGGDRDIAALRVPGHA